jgi:leucine dehydrogenase
MFESIEKLQEFDNHRLVVFVVDKDSGLRGCIAIHRGNSGHPSFGATREWNYKTEIDALKDVLRLSRAMSYKSALAGLKYGGGKAVILRNQSVKKSRNLLLKSYAQKVNCLGGQFVTGTDIGISNEDVKIMKRSSKYFVGIKTNPARFTSLGTFYSIQVCLKEVFGKEDIDGRTFAIQGVGKTGYELLKLIYPHGKRVYIADIDEVALKMAKNNFPNIKIVNPSKINKLDVDVFCPCALNHSINWKNLDKFRCSIIVGSANNQLEDNKIGKTLFGRGILYAPDYLVNAGGLISVVDEYENGNSRVQRVTKRVERIKERMQKVLWLSKRRKEATNLIADRMAEKAFNRIA